MNFFRNMVFILVLLLSGCYPDQEESTETIVKPARKTIIASSNVVINVTDENGQTLTGLTARFNKQSKIINLASFFQFDAKDIYKENELLTITDKDGQLYEYALYNIENQVNYHNLTLFRNTEKKVFSASEGTTINYPSGNLNIGLTSTSFTTGNETYAGNVTCLYNEFDLTNPYHFQAIPGGNLIDKNGKYLMIDWVHVFRFDLLTQTEKYLSLTQPKNVTLNVNPDNYHIIHYDRTKKIWVYQGDFLDNQSIAIQHSGMYAVVQLSEPAVITGVFLANDLPMVRQPISYLYDGKKHQTLTTNSGKWEILVPKNKEITIYPEQNCAGPNFGFTATASSALLATGTKNLNLPELRQITLKGSFKDCLANDVQSGFITFQNGTETEYYYIPDPNFDWKIPVCVQGTLSFGAAGTNGETMSDIGFQNDVAELGNVYVLDLKTNT